MVHVAMSDVSLFGELSLSQIWPAVVITVGYSITIPGLVLL